MLMMRKGTEQGGHHLSHEKNARPDRSKKNKSSTTLCRFELAINDPNFVFVFELAINDPILS